MGLWLDRLETGDYADRLEAARHLIRLERLDYEIFLTSMLVGRPRARSSRLREAIERLLIGSADQVLAELKRRAANGTTSTKEDVAREANARSDILAAAFDWARAQEFTSWLMPMRYGKGVKSASCSLIVVFTAEKASRTRAKSIPPVVGGTSLKSRVWMR
jgi:hypothetical protein